MIKLSTSSILAFTGFSATVCGLGIGTAYSLSFLASHWSGGSIGAAPSVTSMLLSSYAWTFALFRLLQLWLPYPSGEVTAGSRMEFAAHFYTLTLLIFFFPIIRTNCMPTPLMRMIYLLLGAKMGDNSYSAGALLDPPLTTMGSNCIIGHDAVVFAHALEGTHYSFAPIVIGNDVTVGTKAIVMPGVHIGDGAIICAGAVVTKNTIIGKGEVWGGIPARKLQPHAHPAQSTVTPEPPLMERTQMAR